MAWIESHQSLDNHRKTLRLCRFLNISRPLAIGHLHLLWHWGLDNVPSNGDLGDITDEEIEMAAMWDGERGAFASALVLAGFIDVTESGRKLHDWWDYAGKLLDRRERDRERKRSSSEISKIHPKESLSYSDGTPAEFPRNSAGTPAEVRTDSMRTQPNPTQPYTTQPNQDTVSSDESPNGSSSSETIGAASRRTNQAVENTVDKQDQKPRDKITNRDVIGCLGDKYRSIPGINPARDDYAIIGQLYNRYGAAAVNEGLDNLAAALARGEAIAKPLSYISRIAMGFARDSPAAKRKSANQGESDVPKAWHVLRRSLERGSAINDT
jgi:hypothetical protein